MFTVHMCSPPLYNVYWQSLNSAVLLQTTLLADLNLAVWYSIAMRTCKRKKNLPDFNVAVERHTAKLLNLIPHKFSSYTV